MGFDVHAFGAGEELWLGGVLIPHDKGLAGHSDADVALHALTDALLGAIGAGDIGSAFPAERPAMARRRLRAVPRACRDAGRARAAASSIIVDLTIICEAPKIGPHREAIRARIAALLRLRRSGH